MKMLEKHEKRIFAYIVVVICCLTIGCFIAIDIIEFPIKEYISLLWEKNVILYFLFIIISYALFLKEYVFRYKEESNSKIRYTVIMQIVVISAIVLNSINTFDYYKCITLLIAIISLFSAIFYHYLSNISMYLVRFELVWPSLFTVAVTIYTGYAIVNCFSQPTHNKDILYGYGVFLFYTILVFLSRKKDIDNNESSQNPGKIKFRKKHLTGNIWYVHMLGIITLILFASGGKKSVIITLLCVSICAVMTIFESWDILSRRTDKARKRYEAGLGFVSCIFLVFSTIVLVLFESIGAWYAVIIIFSMLVANFLSFLIGYFNYFDEDRVNQSKIIDTFKVSAYIIVSLLLIIPGLLKIISLPRLQNSFEIITFKNVENWKVYGVSISILVPALEAIAAVFSIKKDTNLPSISTEISKLWESLIHSFQVKSVLLWYTLCCFFGIIWSEVVYTNSYNNNGITLRKVVIFKYIFLGASIIYILLYVFCKNNSSSKESSTPQLKENKTCKEDSKMKKNTIILAIKFLQMFHFPSCILLMLMIVIPCMNKIHSLWNSILISIPFVLAAMGSFALNDYYDYDKDKINKPDRILPLGLIKKTSAQKIGIIISALSFFTAIFAAKNGWELAMYWTTTLLALFYNRFIKEISPIKAFYTAAVLAIPFNYSILRWGNVDNIWLYSFGVFLYVAGKEIMMDVYDCEGDKVNGMKTISILLGKKASVIISFVFHMCAFICFFRTFYIKSIYLLLLGLIFSIFCYLVWITNIKKLQRSVIYCLWIPLIIYTIQGWI